MVGDGGVVAPHIELPLSHADQTGQNAAAVNSDAHVDVYSSVLSGGGKGVSRNRKGKCMNKPEFAIPVTHYHLSYMVQLYK